MTDNEIIKALKCLRELVLVEGCLQRAKTIRNALDLINRLQARVEYYKKNRNKYQDDVMYLSKQLDNLQAENERLKKNLNIELENYATEYDNKIKAEAYKEFAERLKIRSHTIKNADGIVVECTPLDYIDRLLKELVGDNK